MNNYVVGSTLLFSALLFCVFGVMEVRAEIHRVYHPYVEQDERELEYGFALRDAGDSNLLLNRVGMGYAWNDKLFTEVYLLNDSITHEGDKIRGYELEAKWQLTEQGEYWADWGLLMEIGTAKDINSHEFALGVLWEKELASDWVATANAIAEYEYGSDIKDEFETALRAQLRYRYSIRFEPAFEIYLDDQDWAAGPTLMGRVKLSGRTQLGWELGLLFGLNSDTPENNLRGGIELEF